MAKPAVKPPPVNPPASPAPTPASAASPAAGEKPLHTIRYGNVRGLIWKTEVNGQATFTLSVDHCVTDKAGNHQVSQTFAAADLSNLAKATAEARKWVEWQQKRLADSSYRA